MRAPFRRRLDFLAISFGGVGYSETLKWAVNKFAIQTRISVCRLFIELWSWHLLIGSDWPEWGEAELNWTGLNWIGLDWIGWNWVVLNWTGVSSEQLFLSSSYLQQAVSVWIISLNKPAKQNRLLSDQIKTSKLNFPKFILAIVQGVLLLYETTDPLVFLSSISSIYGSLAETENRE